MPFIRVEYVNFNCQFRCGMITPRDMAVQLLLVTSLNRWRSYPSLVAADTSFQPPSSYPCIYE
jgi:hypothetical protein